MVDAAADFKAITQCRWTTFSCKVLALFTLSLRPRDAAGVVAKYCNERVCVCVCLSASIADLQYNAPNYTSRV